MIWRKYKVTLKFRERLVGGVPQNPDDLRRWLELRGKEQHFVETLNSIEQAQAPRIGFLRDEQGLYIEARQVCAGLKEAANVLKQIANVKNMRAKVKARVFVYPARIHLGRKAPDGDFIRIVHGMTMLGPRTSMKICEYVEKPEITFFLKVLDDGVITEEHLRMMFEWLSEAGLGAERAQGEGKFEVKSIERC